MGRPCALQLVACASPASWFNLVAFLLSLTARHAACPSATDSPVHARTVQLNWRVTCDANKVIELEDANEGRNRRACPACLLRCEFWSTLERKVATAGSYKTFCPKPRRPGRQDLIRQASATY